MITVAENKIVAIPYNDFYKNREGEIFANLRGKSKRDWFSTHAYYCLPLVIGNQYGFVVKSLIDATIVWNGKDGMQDTKITIHQKPEDSIQSMKSHFGLGIITVQTPYTLRTPPNVSLMTMQPPNYYIDGIQSMVGVIETDNLRRDFTFNLKVTRADHPIRIQIGDFLAAFLPIPRNFVDNFEIVDGHDEYSQDLIAEEQKAIKDFGLERQGEDLNKPHEAGRRYHKGEDVYGNKFVYSHQTNLKPKKRVESEYEQKDYN